MVADNGDEALAHGLAECVAVPLAWLAGGEDEEMMGLSFETGLPVDHIVKAIKWLFIEQDIRYWNYSGRNMTWGLVPDPE